MNFFKFDDSIIEGSETCKFHVRNDRKKNKFVWVSHVSFTNYLEMNYKDIKECYNLKNFDTEIKNCFYRLELELKK